MSVVADFPSGAKVLLNANNVDGVYNASAVHGGSVATWKNLGDPGVADFDTQGTDRLAPTFRTSPRLTSVLWDGIQNGLSSLSSKSSLAFMHTAGEKFDLLISLRRRHLIQSTPRRLFGSQALASSTAKGMQVITTIGTDILGNVKVSFGDGTFNRLDFLSTVKTPADRFVSLLIRNDGTKIRITTDFFDWQSATFTGALSSSGDSTDDYSIGDMVTNSLKCPGDIQVLAIYNRNLSPAELVQIRSAVESQVANCPLPNSYVVCLGDSLTLGLADLDLHPWPVQLEIAEDVVDATLVANFGHSGGKVADMQSDFDNQISLLDPLPDTIILTAPVNNLIAGDSSAVIYPQWKSLVDSIIAAGMQVLTVETPPWGNYVSWSAGAQAQFDLLRPLQIAYRPAGVVGNVNLYALMGQTADPTKMRTILNYGDGLHLNAAGDAFVASTLSPHLAAAITQLAASVSVAPPTFGVTFETVRAHHFPQWTAFTANSNPRATTITEKILECAGELEAKLAQEFVTASSVTDPASAAYLWCEKTLKLMAAIEVLTVATQQAPEVSKDWEKWLAARWTDLAERGHLALGTGTSAPTIQPDGPSHFISQLGIDVGDVRRDASRGIPPFRRDDEQ